MTSLKISQLPVVDTLTGEEIFPIVAEGTNKGVLELNMVQDKVLSLAIWVEQK